MRTSTNESTMVYWAAGAAVLALIVIGLGWGYLQYQSNQAAHQAAEAAQNASASLDTIAANTNASVPSTQNPLKAATPAVNPVDAANPFNGTSANTGTSNGYHNPFQ